MGALPLGPFRPPIAITPYTVIVTALPLLIVHFGQQVQQVLKSPSISTTALPRVWSMPADRAASLPKLRDKGQVAQGKPPMRHQLHGHVLRGVGTAVIGDDDFKVGRKLRRRFGQRRDKAGGFTTSLNAGTHQDKRSSRRLAKAAGSAAGCIQ